MNLVLLFRLRAVRRCYSSATAASGALPVHVVGQGLPSPWKSFAEGSFHRQILTTIEKAGFQSLSQIQAHALPIALSGRDLVGVSQTGSGKTLAYALPAIQRVLEADKQQSTKKLPRALVLAPTRELAVQIRTETDRFGRAVGLRNACLFGGAAKHQQIAELREGPHLVVATPGRLMDLIESRPDLLTLSHVDYLVLDEADRMLDMGFEPQVRKICSNLSPAKKPQILMFSATWPREIQKLAADFMEDFAHVTIGSDDLACNHDIAQQFVQTTRLRKKDQLMTILQDLKASGSPVKVLIFVNTKRDVDFLEETLSRKGFKVVGLSGDRSQSQRDYAMDAFKRGSASLLVATDVAARGIDVKDITHVINYDLPGAIDSYVHRVGRTGRAGKSGTAISLLTDEDARLARDLVRVVTEANQKVPPVLADLGSAQLARPFSPSRSSYGARGSGYDRGSSFGSNRGGPNAGSRSSFGSYRGGGGSGGGSSFGSYRGGGSGDGSGFGSYRGGSGGDGTGGSAVTGSRGGSSSFGRGWDMHDDDADDEGRSSRQSNGRPSGPGGRSGSSFSWGSTDHDDSAPSLPWKKRVS
eukprot:NODE_132_length_2038_cov_125.452489_g101_i0.p1 GENE.NODE_132_length_2038_cov_125.452489_g101_i0~~NODE_132_length_2038_cov_125.452489_g101_i0.p1  ORF type:complete len:584 (+),score=148.81 NODE_132_length_2038_cov_125.452489_g101_i0:56-1807(+)